MKILQLGKFYPIPGGVEKVMYELTTGLSRRGIECDMLCANLDLSEKNVKELVLTDKNKIIICPTKRKVMATMIAPSMIKELKKRCNYYDIIHVHHPDPMAALALYLSGYKGKVVLHWHSDILKQSFMLKLYKPLQNWLTRRADVIVGTTPIYIKESPHLTKVQDKCTYLPIGVDPIMWNEDGVEKIRNKYSGKRIVFSLGRLVSYKGYEYLIDAAKYVPDDCVVLIGGSGPLHDELQKQIDDNALNGKVELLGRVGDEDLPDYFRAADVYCLSSTMKTEAFAIVQVEAMSCATPIVATKIPGSGVSWVNADGESGINVEPRDAKALGDAITQLLCDAELHAKLSAGARERYEHLFRKEEMITKCLGIYSTLNIG